MLFGQHFVWVTDCYAIKFILLYDGANTAILCLQMPLMGWDVNIVHRNNHYITDADYWSRLGADLCLDLLFKTYLDLTRKLSLENPPPTSFPMKPENMLYYHGPRVIPASQNDQAPEDAHCEPFVSTVFVDNSYRLCHLANVPVQFGDFGKAPLPASCPLLNNEFPCYAQQVLRFSWAVYSFQGGHFASTIQSRNLPFCVSIACNPYEVGGSLFQELTACRHIFSSANNMLHYIRASGDTFVIHGYLIHSPRFQTSKTTTTFWQLQAAIISQLHLICSLSIIIAIIHPDHNGRSVKTFSAKLKLSSWILSSMDVHFPVLGNSIVGLYHVITAIRSS
jgi:hypothetical protein